MSGVVEVVVWAGEGGVIPRKELANKSEASSTDNLRVSQEAVEIL